jgi:hypothetical protein
LEGALKITDTNDVLAWLRTIDECLRAQRSMCFGQLNRKSVFSSTKANTDVPFVPITTTVDGFYKATSIAGRLPVCNRAPREL